ncbi:hypothetical protein CHELA20_50298 [Hyphomicrobiales bacterium]|nr:hypothetical protein CHELA20_50298 [Hyphomicrobiales bacterium]
MFFEVAQGRNDCLLRVRTAEIRRALGCAEAWLRDRGGRDAQARGKPEQRSVIDRLLSTQKRPALVAVNKQYRAFGRHIRVAGYEKFNGRAIATTNHMLRYSRHCHHPHMRGAENMGTRHPVNHRHWRDSRQRHGEAS